MSKPVPAPDVIDESAHPYAVMQAADEAHAPGTVISTHSSERTAITAATKESTRQWVYVALQTETGAWETRAQAYQRLHERPETRGRKAVLDGGRKIDLSLNDAYHAIACELGASFNEGVRNAVAQAMRLTPRPTRELPNADGKRRPAWLDTATIDAATELGKTVNAGVRIALTAAARS
jgi:hypothetical protein